VTGVVGNPAGASVSIKALELRCPPSDRRDWVILPDS
jgi:hypothetical protein